MAEDKKNPSNILYVEHHCLKTMSLATRISELVVGSCTQAGYQEGSGATARVNIIAGFYQIDSNSVLLVDTYNHCIRMLDRTTNTTSVLAGKCAVVAGYNDGGFQNAEFNTPFKIISYGDHYFISDYGNLVIRKLQLDTQEISTFVNVTEKPNALLLSLDGEYVFFSWFKGVGRVNLRTKEVVFITSPDKRYHGFRDGPTERAVFERVEEMVYLSESLILMTDVRNNVLRLLNMLTNSVSTICNRGNRTITGTIETCELNFPRSLLVLKDRNQVLIGSLFHMGYVNITGMSLHGPEKLK